MKNFNDVIQQLIDTNEQLIEGKIKLEVAKQIANNVQVIINAAKVYIEVGKMTKTNISFFNDKIVMDMPRVTMKPKAAEERTNINDCEIYNKKCKTCIYLKNIITVQPPFITCAAHGIKEPLLLDFKKCKYITDQPD